MANGKSEEIQREMIALSVDTIRYIDSLHLPRSVNDQLVRAVTSIGANFTEAQDASSKKDFVNKIYIAKKEAAEAKYWLSIVAGLTRSSEQLEELKQRVQKFVMMLQKIVNTSKGANRT